MPKRAVAMFLVCAGMATLVSCINNTSNRYLYAALPTPNEIVVYREDPNSGVLTTLTISPVSAGLGVHSIAIHPSNKFLYAVNSFEDDISLYTVSASGALSEVTPRATTGTTPTQGVIDSAGQFLYVINSGSDNISSYSIGSGGTLTQVAGSPFPIGAGAINMRVSPSGNFLYVTLGVGVGGSPGSIEIWPLNAGVLGMQGVQIVAAGTTPSGMAIDAAGANLYVSNFGDNSISQYSIGTDGSLSVPHTIGAGLGVLSSPVALQIDNSGKYLYVANETGSTVVAYSIGTGGSLALLPANYSVATNSTPSVLATDSSGNYLFVGNNVNPEIQSFNLDTSTGVLTSVASYSLGGNGTTSIALSP